MKWNDKKIEKSIEILSKSETVAKACNELTDSFGDDISPSSLRHAFKRNGYDSPSNYLKEESEEKLEEESGDEESAPEYEPDGNYHWNELNNLYLVFVPHKRKPLQIPGQKLEEMKEAYSNYSPGGGSTINEICRTFNISRKDFYAVKTALKWTHDEDPYTDEQHLQSQPNDLAESLIQKKRQEFDRIFRKKEWKQIENDALSWREFIYMLGCEPKLKSVKASLEHISAASTYCENLDVDEVVNEMTIKNSGNGSTLIIPISDIHYGKNFESTNDNHYSFNKTELGKRLARAMGYVEYMKEHLNRVDNILYLCLGDNFEALFGNMREGQFLTMDSFGTSQYQGVINFHVSFLNFLRDTFPDKQITSLFQAGNHDRLFANRAWNSEEIVNFIMTDRIASEFKDDASISVAVGAPIVSIMLGNGVNLLSQHGHLKKLRSNKDIASFISIHGNPSAKRYLVGQGHLHELSYKSGFNYKFFVNSSFCGNDEYNLNKLLVGSPAELIFIESCATTDLFYGPFNLEVSHI